MCVSHKLLPLYICEHVAIFALNYLRHFKIKVVTYYTTFSSTDLNVREIKDKSESNYNGNLM